MPNTPKNSAVSLLLLSCLGSFVVAVLFVVTFQFSLPPSDGAYGQTPFQDPLVFPVMLAWAAVFAVAAFLFAFWLLRSVDLGRSFVVVLLSTLAGMLLVTSLLGILGVPAAFLAMVCSMFFCRDRYARSV